MENKSQYRAVVEKRSKKSLKAKLKRSIRKFKREFKYRMSIFISIVVLCLIFVAAYFLVHGDNLGGGHGGTMNGGNHTDTHIINPGTGEVDGGSNDVSGNVSGSTVSGTMEVHYIDVGQGDATLIRCGDKAMLIDAGDNSKGTKVQKYLQNLGITKLDYVIATHPDSDHIGGLDVVIYKFECDTILMTDESNDSTSYRDLISAINSKSYKKTLPVVGQEYLLGDAIFTILAPNRAYGDLNESSIGILLQYGEKKFLFTGDAESKSEADIVARGINIDCDVYKAGHHGSKTSSSEILLNAAKPKYVVISCGEGNDYGHPHAQTLNQLRVRGIKVFRTDEQGTIVAVTDGKNITWNCAPSESWKVGE